MKKEKTETKKSETHQQKTDAILLALKDYPRAEVFIKKPDLLKLLKSHVDEQELDDLAHELESEGLIHVGQTDDSQTGTVKVYCIMPEGAKILKMNP